MKAIELMILVMRKKCFCGIVEQQNFVSHISIQDNCWTIVNIKDCTWPWDGIKNNSKVVISWNFKLLSVWGGGEGGGESERMCFGEVT